MAVPKLKPIEERWPRAAAILDAYDRITAEAQEKYEKLMDDAGSGVDITDDDLTWMKRYEEHWLN